MITSISNSFQIFPSITISKISPSYFYVNKYRLWSSYNIGYVPFQWNMVNLAVTTPLKELPVPSPSLFFFAILLPLCGEITASFALMTFNNHVRLDLWPSDQWTFIQYSTLPRSSICFLCISFSALYPYYNWCPCCHISVVITLEHDPVLVCFILLLVLHATQCILYTLIII